MTIEMILAASRQKNGDLGIANKGEIPWYIPEDLQHFKELTLGHIVVMGRKTFESLPRALEGRRNIVISSDPSISFEGAETVCSFEAVLLLAESANPEQKVFIIGGAALYCRFMPISSKIHLTEIQNYFECDTRVIGGIQDIYELSDFSEVKERGIIKYRFLTYTRELLNITNESKYLKLMKEILNYGTPKEDRTGTGTISLFGTQLKLDISGNKLPLVTTKKVSFNIILEELLWFCRGDTDSKILSRKGIKIWEGNSSREFLDSRGLNYPEGVTGPIYGWQWRRFGAPYNVNYSDSSACIFPKGAGIDQLARVEHLLRTDPFNRRILMSAWNPLQLDEMALPPCHLLVNFFVEEIDGIKYLSCHFVMRSSDYFLATNMNCVSYAILTKILALKCGMVAKNLCYSCTDTHIYSNHIEQVKKQSAREPRAPPLLKISESVKEKDWSEITASDFDLIGYFPASGIVASMAV